MAWCPTDAMTGDFWTKPLQGALFRKFRDLVMGVVPQPDLRMSEAMHVKEGAHKVKKKPLKKENDQNQRN